MDEKTVLKTALKGRVNSIRNLIRDDVGASYKSQDVIEGLLIKVETKGVNLINAKRVK